MTVVHNSPSSPCLAVMNIFPIVPILGHLLLSYPNTNIAQILARNMNHGGTREWIFTSSKVYTTDWLISIHNSVFSEFMNFSKIINYTPPCKIVWSFVSSKSWSKSCSVLVIISAQSSDQRTNTLSLLANIRTSEQYLMKKSKS